MRTAPKRLLLGVLAPLVLAGGCGVKFLVHEPYELEKVCSATVIPIAINARQEEFRREYFPRFRENLREALGGRIQLTDWKDADKRGLSWEKAVEEGEKLGVDAVIGLLISDSAHPPKRTQILKVVKSSGGRVIVRQNRLMDPRPDYSFKKEIGGLRKLLRCGKK